MNEASASSEDNTDAAHRRQRPWRLALLWLAVLATVFYVSYGFAGWLAMRRPGIEAVVFGWEQYVPFVAWTIVPYASIAAFYGLSTLVCSTGAELTTHGRRLLTAQAIAVVFFSVYPLASTFEQLDVDGPTGALLILLANNGTEFNQALSLHTALLVVLYVHYARHVPLSWRLPLTLWFGLAGLAALTAYQHHFIGVPTGALAGWFCVWLWPGAIPGPLTGFSWSRDRRRWRLAMYYGAAGVVATSLAFWTGGAGLWLIWPALSLLLIAAFYAGVGRNGFQKGPDGRMSAAAQWLLAPYLLGAWINSRLWTRRNPEPSHVLDQVWIGRFPSQNDIRSSGSRTVIDLTAELPVRAPPCAWHCIPMLDLVTASSRTLIDAAGEIERHRENGPVLVCCALGYGRSAAVLVTWLLRSGRAETIEAAVALVRDARPKLVLHAADHNAIALAAADGKR